MLITLHFVWNRNYIAQTYCINKDKPYMQCKGACFLKKSLKNNNQAEQSIPCILKEKGDQYINPEQEFICHTYAAIQIKPDGVYCLSMYPPLIFKVLSPPPDCLKIFYIEGY